MNNKYFLLFELTKNNLKIDIKLSNYEDMYDTFDRGHSRRHMEEVRVNAIKLANLYSPSEIKLAYIAATLHDIGLSKSRENHEIVGSKMILSDKYLLKKLGEEDLYKVAYAVQEHRYSTGNPKTVLAKIIADSDRLGKDIGGKITRAVFYGIENLNIKKLSIALIRAVEHQLEKFNPFSMKLHFPESRKQIIKQYKETKLLANSSPIVIWKKISQKDQKDILQICKKLNVEIDV